jgi:two-component system phosphate regulon response regulator OmpR
VLRIGNILKRARRRRRRRWSGRVRPLRLHLARGELRQGEEIIHLTDREREMLRILAARRARPCRARR